MSTDDLRLTTAEAADRLGVKPETLYAYVSRGLIERRRTPGGPSTFAARDVERLVRAGRRTRSLPPLVFPSSLTLIADGRYAYRGVDAVAASRAHRFEEVAEWLWRGSWPDEVRWPFDAAALDDVLAAQAAASVECLPLDRYRIIAAVAAAADPVRHRTEPDVVVPAARRLLRLLVHGLPRADGREARRVEPARSMAEVLWTRLTTTPRTPARVGLLDAALVLLADHELPSSTLAVRTAAMVRADVYEVVGTGLSVCGGLRHGGASLGVEALLHEAARVGPERALADRLDRGDRIPGFGHPLYPDGDPRAPVLLDGLDALDLPAERVSVVRAVVDGTTARTGLAPNVDAALAALSYAAAMAPGAGEATFALARTAGWVAHALEQYETPTFMRTRVDYVGPRVDDVGPPVEDIGPPR
ncbi:citrate/2-methylcitrate synthase [Iamia majanohamensis]|uniref:citrate synthase (unknown stereospecificity) n=1 Tax=Iamia majanohamensis TaxID=467976 RepID=A0AAE9YDT8_9ACTN|nr:citrate/2-methylcitrate synthase [Iamia majanohamensis]WCO66992.1 citrate/2-methylcitrate synthase [Iamia majanohamensis]